MYVIVYVYHGRQRIEPRVFHTISQARTELALFKIGGLTAWILPVKEAADV